MGALDVQDSISAELLNDISLMDANNRTTQYTHTNEVGADGIDINLASQQAVPVRRRAPSELSPAVLNRTGLPRDQSSATIAELDNSQDSIQFADRSLNKNKSTNKIPVSNKKP